jgi:glutamate---cysteine ligase / carboxylate-amine ligase
LQREQEATVLAKRIGVPIPAWAKWNSSRSYTIGIEEEVMLLDPHDWSLAQRIDDILPRLSPELACFVTAETHAAAIELASSPHETAASAAQQMQSLRVALSAELAGLGLRAGSAGTHPTAVWTDTKISSGARYQLIYNSMHELAHREPTFALHVHIGVSDPEAAIRLHNRMRAHVPLLLALSGNSPYWQGRNTGLASARTPLFQAFPRVGIPRAFASYAHYVETVDLLLTCEAFPEPTFLWWDVRPQPRLGTVEVRIMDAQTTGTQSATLAALVASIAHLELEEGYHPEELIDAPELLAENRFLAARDGMQARLLDPIAARPLPATQLLERLLEAVRPHAADLGCADGLEPLAALASETGAARQVRIAGADERLDHLVASISDAFTE